MGPREEEVLDPVSHEREPLRPRRQKIVAGGGGGGRTRGSVDPKADSVCPPPAPRTSFVVCLVTCCHLSFICISALACELWEGKDSSAVSISVPSGWHVVGCPFSKMMH